MTRPFYTLWANPLFRPLFGVFFVIWQEVRGSQKFSNARIFHFRGAERGREFARGGFFPRSVFPWKFYQRTRNRDGNFHNRKNVTSVRCNFRWFYVMLITGDSLDAKVDFSEQSVFIARATTTNVKPQRLKGTNTRAPRNSNVSLPMVWNRSRSCRSMIKARQKNYSPFAYVYELPWKLQLRYAMVIVTFQGFHCFLNVETIFICRSSA